MILHHYELSPFSEKTRLMFGYCGLPWQSAISPAMPPRSIVDPLAGGYRRIPVAQIGADIFCDTKIISAELASIANKAELEMDANSDEIQQFAIHVDTVVFMASLQSASSLTVLMTVFRLFSPFQAVKFIKDRAGVQKSSSLKPIGRQRSLAILNNHYTDMESKLNGSDFLFGCTPCIADFSAFHVLWFNHLTNKTSMLEGFEQVNAWYQRMSDFGHGQRSELSKNAVFEVAKKAQPREISTSMKQDEAVGLKVQIKPNDYAKDAVEGVLVGSDEVRWILARETEEFGTLHVHFPKSGFEMLQAN